jgi:peptidoglycan hydrolase-like protein with peptidoglycan-binding domain
VQQTLKNLGYDPGPIDGHIGARTRRAIIAFQNDLGVAPTGTINDAIAYFEKASNEFAQRNKQRN